jgi:hypothetical protein
MTKDETIAELLMACKLAKAAIGNAVEFVNDGEPPTTAEAISELHLVLYRAIDRAEPSPRQKLMNAYKQAGTANALWVQKRYGRRSVYDEDRS